MLNVLKMFVVRMLSNANAKFITFTSLFHLLHNFYVTSWIQFSEVLMSNLRYLKLF